MEFSKNLNEALIKSDEGLISLIDHNTSVPNACFDKVECFFKNLTQNLIEKIDQHKSGFVFGNVAWLTSDKILDALADCENVQLLLQKEDFLRPDYVESLNLEERKRKYRYLYSKLKFSFDRLDCLYPICDLSYAGDISMDSVRCVGHNNSDRKKTMPRAHNKFLVFCAKEKDYRRGDTSAVAYKPIAVWTGSFNFTFNGEMSLENALYLEDSSGNNPIISAYLKEHHQIFALSEPLNWESEWSEPEFRIGT